jgi:uncharacterized protein (DUF952 family)
VAIITHFTKQEIWSRALREGAFTIDSLDKEGFIHCSTPEQVVAVANGIAKEWTDVILLWIDEDRVQQKIVYENLEGGSTLFPHIYGPLNIDAVIKVTPFLKNDDGSYKAPTLSLQGD